MSLILCKLYELYCQKSQGSNGRYSEATSFGDDTLKRSDILFKQTPYDVKARR